MSFCSVSGKDSVLLVKTQGWIFEALLNQSEEFSSASKVPHNIFQIVSALECVWGRVVHSQYLENSRWQWNLYYRSIISHWWLYLSFHSKFPCHFSSGNPTSPIDFLKMQFSFIGACVYRGRCLLPGSIVEASAQSEIVSFHCVNFMDPGQVLRFLLSLFAS